MEAEHPPLPPFTTTESAVQKVRLAENAWNSRDPVRVPLGYTPGPVAKPCRICRRSRTDSDIPRPEMGPRARLSPDKGSVDIHEQSDCRAACLQMAR